MRILHLIDHGADQLSREAESGGESAMLACRSLIEHLSAHHHEVCIIGGSNSRAVAVSHGLSPDIHIAAPMGHPTFAYRSLKRVVADRGQPDLVHCWSASTLSLCQAALPSIACAAMLMNGPPKCGPVRGSRMPLHSASSWWLSRSIRQASVVVLSERSKSEWQQSFGNIRSVRVAPLPRLVIDQTLSKESFRSENAIERDELVLLLLGQTPTHADAMRFMFLLDVLHVSTPGVVGLVSSGASQVARGLRFQSRRKNSWRALISDRPLPDLLSVADVAVCEGHRFAPESSATAPFASTSIQIAAAHNMGVPVVAPREMNSPDLYTPDAASACIAFNTALPELARKLLPLHHDRELLDRVIGSLTSVPATPTSPTFESVVEAAWNESLAASPHSADTAVTLPA